MNNVKHDDLTQKDIVMLQLMEALRESSACIDKQVVCIIVDGWKNYHEYGKKGCDGKLPNIVSIGVNDVEECNRNCHDKENRVCKVRHAEICALDNLLERNITSNAEVYVNLFPCVPCQKALMDYGIWNITAFGMVHKEPIMPVRVVPYLSYKLIANNPIHDRLSISAIEFQELSKALLEYAHRPDKPITEEEHVDRIMDEMIDCELQLNTLKIALQANVDPDFFRRYAAQRAKKYREIVNMLQATNLQGKRP